MSYNIIIWGTGKFARKRLNQAGGGWNQLKQDINILGFIDNDSSKWGDKFEGKEIFSADRLKIMDYDYIVVASTFESEIKKQIQECYNISETRILNFSSLIKKWAYDGKRTAFQKEVILWNHEWQGWKDILCYLSMWFKPIAFCSKVVEKGIIIDNIPCINIEQLYQINYSYIIISEEHKEIENEMIKYNIDKDKIVILSENRLIYRDYCNIRKKFGGFNKEKIFYCIWFPWPRTGLCGFLIYVLAKLIESEKQIWIPIVDAKYIPNQYLKKKKLGIDNAWEYYFKQLSDYSLEEVYHSKNVIIPAISVEENIALNINSKSSIKKYCDVWEKIELQPILKDSINRAKKQIFNNDEKYLGVLFRGTDYTNKEPYGHPRQPDLDSMISKVKQYMKEWGYQKIFLCTEVKEAVEVFEKEFKNNVSYIEQVRFEMNTSEWLYKSTPVQQEDNGYLIGLNYFTAITILSMCDSLVACKTAGTNMAIIMNNNGYKHRYLFELGTYGI